MRKLLSGVCVVLGLLAGLSTADADMCSSDPNNLVSNCGFETGDLTDWNSTGHAGVNLLAYQGSHAAFLQAGGNFPADASIFMNLNVTPATEYTATFYLKDEVDDPHQVLEASAIDSKGTTLHIIELNGSQPAYANYTKATFDFISDTALVKLQFLLIDSVGNAQWGIDDVTVDQTPSNVPAPPALALFGTALAGMAIMRRRKRPVQKLVQARC